MGVSGREEPALSVAEKFLSDYTDDIKISNGSLMAVCGNKIQIKPYYWTLTLTA